MKAFYACDDTEYGVQIEATMVGSPVVTRKVTIKLRRYHDSDEEFTEIASILFYEADGEITLLPKED